MLRPVRRLFVRACGMTDWNVIKRRRGLNRHGDSRCHQTGHEQDHRHKQTEGTALRGTRW